MLLCYNFAPINIDFFLNGKVIKCYKKMYEKSCIYGSFCFY